MNIVDIKKTITILLVVINIVFICQNNVLANDIIYESDGTFRWKQVSSTTEDKYNVIWRKN